MANSKTSTLLVNSDKEYAVHYKIIGDGSGEETTAIVNNTSGDIGTSANVVSIKGCLVGFSAGLYWDATTDDLIMALPADHDFCFELRCPCPIPNPNSSGVTGNIILKTTGLGSGDIGAFVIEIRK